MIGKWPTASHFATRMVISKDLLLTTPERSMSVHPEELRSKDPEPFQRSHVIASSGVTTDCVSTASHSADATARRSHPSVSDYPTAVHVTVPVSAAAGLSSSAGVETEELVFHEDHFSLDPVELCKLRFLSGDTGVVDDLVEELEGSWQVFLRECTARNMISKTPW